MTKNEKRATLYTAGIILGLLTVVSIIAAYPAEFFSIAGLIIVLWGGYSFIRVMWTEIKLKLDKKEIEDLPKRIIDKQRTCNHAHWDCDNQIRTIECKECGLRAFIDDYVDLFDKKRIK